MANAYGIRIGAPVDMAWSSLVGITNTIVDASNDGVGVTHRARSADAITKIGFRYGARTGTPPTFRASLQSLNTSGVPSGTVLGGGSPASATFTPPANATWDGTWREVTLDNSYTPARGEAFAICIEYSSGTIDGSNNSSFTIALTGGNVVANLPTLVQSAGSWAKSRHGCPISYYTASACVGWPSTGFTSTTYAATSTPDEYALRFKLPAGWGDTYQVVGVYTFMFGLAGGAFDLVLYSGTTALQSISFDSDQLATPGAPAILIFDEATLETLSYGTEYRVSIKPTSGTSGQFAWAICNSATEAAAFQGGPEFFLSTRTDEGAWSDDTAKRPFVELILADITEPSGSSGVRIPQGMVGGMVG